jgi:hypothetical protein
MNLAHLGRRERPRLATPHASNGILAISSSSFENFGLLLWCYVEEAPLGVLGQFCDLVFPCVVVTDGRCRLLCSKAARIATCLQGWQPPP